MSERVVVTGVGVVSALGTTRAAFADALWRGDSGIGPIRSISPDLLRVRIGAEVPDFAPEATINPRQLSTMALFTQYAIVAAEEALAQAGVPWTPMLQERAAVVLGSSLGGREAEERGYRELFETRSGHIHPLTIPMSMNNAATSHVSMRFGLQGPAWTVSTACASATHAIGQAAHLVRSGAAPLALAGGAEAPFFLGGMKAWEAMRVLSRDTCRPFSKERSGMVLGEGAAVLVLEPLTRALERGAQPLAEVAGFGMSADAGHLTQPDPSGATRAMRAALMDAGLEPAQVGYVNAHGTGTEANDRTEASAIREVFGGQPPPVSSTKSLHGHALGAAGALEAAACVLALCDGMLPPTANFLTPDPACDLDVIPNQARRAQVEACLSNSFAFGGLNAVLAFRRAPARDAGAERG